MIRPFLYLQSKASIWILFTKCSFKWYFVLPPCHLSWFTFQRRIYISSLECCLRENVRDDLQYNWYPMPFFHIWSIWHEIFGQENSKRSISSIHMGVFLDLAQWKLQNCKTISFCGFIAVQSLANLFHQNLISRPFHQVKVFHNEHWTISSELQFLTRAIKYKHKSRD